MPKPVKGESKNAYLQRCMNSEESKKSFPDTKQRYAVCNSYWDDKDKKKR